MSNLYPDIANYITKYNLSPLQCDLCAAKADIDNLPTLYNPSASKFMCNCATNYITCFARVNYVNISRRCNNYTVTITAHVLQYKTRSDLVTQTYVAEDTIGQIYSSNGVLFSNIANSKTTLEELETILTFI